MQRIVSAFYLVALFALAVAPARAQWSKAALSQNRRFPAAASLGGKALFAGGEFSGTSSSVVDIYDDASGTWSTDTLSQARNFVAATVVGDLALFAGGVVDATTFSDVVDVYDAQTMTFSTMAPLSQARWAVAATSDGNTALFAGGISGSFASPLASNVVDIWNAQTGLWSVTTLSVPRGLAAAVTVGNLALFAGGQDPATGVLDTVDIYEYDTGRWSTAALWEPRYVMSEGACAVGTRAYFGGGVTGPGGAVSGVIDVFDALTGSWSTMTLPVARGDLSAVALGNTVLFAGGFEDGWLITDAVDLFDVGTGQWSSASLSNARADMGSTTVGGKALFAGGTAGPGLPKKRVDLYEPVGLNYCTAGSSASGCRAGIAASGTPSASLATGFFLTASGVEGGKDGLFFFGTSGRQASPWGNGSSYQCVVPPVSRGGLQTASGTAGQCDGAFSQDLNARWTQKPAQNPGAGATLQAQLWYRDPLNTSNQSTSFSDALELTVQP
jgi:hypothetical protein